VEAVENSLAISPASSATASACDYSKTLSTITTASDNGTPPCHNLACCGGSYGKHLRPGTLVGHPSPKRKAANAYDFVFVLRKEILLCLKCCSETHLDSLCFVLAYTFWYKLCFKC